MTVSVKTRNHANHAFEKLSLMFQSLLQVILDCGLNRYLTTLHLTGYDWSTIGYVLMPKAWKKKTIPWYSRFLLKNLKLHFWGLSVNDPKNWGLWNTRGLSSRVLNLQPVTNPLKKTGGKMATRRILFWGDKKFISANYNNS